MTFSTHFQSSSTMLHGVNTPTCVNVCFMHSQMQGFANHTWRFLH